jgi:hypothetical protein
MTSVARLPATGGKSAGPLKILAVVGFQNFFTQEPVRVDNTLCFANEV